MEYFIGSIVTLGIVLGINLFARRLSQSSETIIRPSQSYVYSVIGPYMVSNEQMSEPIVSQASKYMDKLFVKIVIVENQAYWIQDSVFYVANYINNQVDKDSAKEVDTMSMDKVQLNKIMFIVEKLREGAYDDNWNTGKP